ncbi:MAG TPA: phosphoribosylamine--glycine ligase [Candidatus Hydrogenedentes bacterium]|nr:phosphoribosylamine--glycine ligase [Candidatus Hydrogenedentota bacterium]HOD94781.1 phosphoribosylamine--glycine ligase [Candidatus Hydrogenedentota bacterium]HOM47872.1 phosphoribosylamine--glycine ligase [Candidatus Hydrogenedentota bacterium]HOR50297.1 phosphoribosylamine--glycine ligase [Candidatus Hydrogenedentota bacterium]HPK24214.1 phosphoribosylamine--glycine ligase [Candidatus Hydrogenedentota bacterium]
MNVLVIGSGGREHALAWKIAQSPLVEKVYGAPGNPGIDRLEKGACINVGVNDFEALDTYIEAEGIDLTVVGPEVPLVHGIVDFLEERGKRVFGPSKKAAQLEGSKSFAKEFMARHGIPTAESRTFDDLQEALAYVRSQPAPIVIKADGLAAGKGVTVAVSQAEAEAAIYAAMAEGAFGEAGARVVVEEYLTGEEASILAFCDGRTVKPLASSQDHKPVGENDEGPNTGGMGAYSPAPVVTDALMEEIVWDVLVPTSAGMAKEGMPYKGILYAGLMITGNGPKVIEYNVRFGDPETQAILPRMETDLVPALLACCNGTLDSCEIRYSPRPCVSVVMASEGYPGVYAKAKEITGVDEAEALEDVAVFAAGVKRKGDQLFSSGGRVLNVTALGNTQRAAMEKAYQAVSCIHFEGAFYRRDIGAKALKHLE